MADVFLSYARSTAARAQRIATELRGQGYDVWFDEQLPAHRAYADVIASELDRAKAVLVLWSKEAASSHWVRSEANRALETGRLVQARLDGARLPMPFDQVQCADLQNGAEPGSVGWQSILHAVAALTERKPPDPPQRPTTSRRTLLIGGGVTAAIATAGLTGWQLLKRDSTSPQAQLLLRKGIDALQSNDALETDDVGSTMQAIAFLTDATEADPRSSVAWGALAMAYAVRRKAAPVPERAGLEQRSRSAAAKAVELNPDDPYSAAALLLLKPLYRHWSEAEKAGREGVRRHPELPIFLFILSEMLGSVGRWKEAAELSRKADRTNFLIPGADRRVVLNLWSAGDLDGADKAMSAAAERWPQHPTVWRTRIAYLLYSGRPAEGLVLLDNEAERPPDTPPGLVPALRALGQALAGTGDRADAIKAALSYLETRPSSALQVAQALVMLGSAGTAFELFDGYYFGQGKWRGLAPPGGDQDRLTGPLFQPPMRDLWRRPEFSQLLSRIGLTRYWDESGTVPDFRRSA